MAAVRTVKEISDLTGISVRALHYYDEIGLLKPTAKSAAGYRLYDDKSLEILQQILFFRELDFPLKEIKDMLGYSRWDYNNITEIKNTYTKRITLGHYFLLPNEVFTLGLSPGELSVYAYLMFCEDRETHQCWPSIGRICQYTGMSANTVAKYIRQLEEERLIDTEPTKVKTKAGLVRNGNLLYTIRPIQEAVNCKLERDLVAQSEQRRTKKKR